MKVGINEVEWYPVYTISTTEEDIKHSWFTIEIPDKDISDIKQMFTKFENYQDQLRVIFKAEEEKIEKKSDIKLMPSKGQT